MNHYAYGEDEFHIEEKPHQALEQLERERVRENQPIKRTYLDIHYLLNRILDHNFF